MPPKNKHSTPATAPATPAPAVQTPAPAQQPPAAQFTYQPTETDIALMRAIDSGNQTGNVRFVSQAEAIHLVNAGLVTVDINHMDPATGNVAAALSETGKVHTMNAPAPAGTAPASGTSAAAITAAAPVVAAPVSFVIATVEPPAIKRTPPPNPNKGQSKYPQLDSLEIGQAIFITAPTGADTKKLSKTFGSSMADRNSRDKTKYFTSRSIPDGKEAGFVAYFAPDAIDPATNQPYPANTINPDAYAGVAGTGLYRRPLEERKTRAPRKPKDGTTVDGTKTPEQIAAEAAAAANAGVAGIPGAGGTDTAGVVPPVV